MATHALLEGAIPQDGVESLLGDLELLGTTGVLCFRSPLAQGQVEIVGGHIDESQLRDETARDSVQLLLSLREGEYAVYPKLPPLPVSRGNDYTKRGSLSVHPPSDLMRYCEDASLTGRLLLEQRGRIAIAHFSNGELEEVSIDDGDAAEFSQCLAWMEGTFRVDSEAASQHPAELDAAGNSVGEQRSDATGIQLLRALESGLAALGSFSKPGAPPVSVQPLLPTVQMFVEDDEDLTIPLARLPSGHLEADFPKNKENSVFQTPLSAPPLQSDTTFVVTDNTDQKPTSLLGTLAWVAVMTLAALLALGVTAWLPALQ